MTKIIGDYDCCATCISMDALRLKPECKPCQIGVICDDCIGICGNFHSDNNRHVFHVAHPACELYKRSKP